MDKLQSVLWAYRAMHRPLINETLFNLIFETEAVTPLEIGSPSYREEAFDVQKNFKDLQANLDLLKEAKEKA